MIKEIVKDQFILGQKSKEATLEDLPIALDLLDTIKAHEENCVGIAANMIGELKRIVVINDHNHYIIMMNPRILKTSWTYYETEEGCLSHEGVKKVKRYEKVKVEYRDENWKIKLKHFKSSVMTAIRRDANIIYLIIEKRINRIVFS